MLHGFLRFPQLFLLSIYSSIGSKIAYIDFKMLIYEHISAKKPCRMGISTRLSEIRN